MTAAAIIISVKLSNGAGEVKIDLETPRDHRCCIPRDMGALQRRYLTCWSIIVSLQVGAVLHASVFPKRFARRRAEGVHGGELRAYLVSVDTTAQRGLQLTRYTGAGVP